MSEKFWESMEVNAEDGVVKYSKLIEENDTEASLIWSQKTMDKLNPNELVLAGIENSDYPANNTMEDTGVDLNGKISEKHQKFGFKPLVGLSLALLIIVFGLIAGLFVMDTKNQSLKLQMKT